MLLRLSSRIPTIEYSLILNREGHKMRGSSFPESSASVLVAA